MTEPGSKSEDRWRLVALLPPLVARVYQDGMEGAGQRLLLLVVAVGLAYGWAALFAWRTQRPLGPGLLPYAMTFVLLLPGAVPWAAAILAVSFGVVFGREIFGGDGVLPPAAIGLAFAIFSFPEGGFEAHDLLTAPLDPLFAAACVPGALLLTWRGACSWRVVIGAVLGSMGAASLMSVSAPWEHLSLGTFAAGVIFLAAGPEATPQRTVARWLHGLLAGALIMLIRLGNPEQPDGVVFAVFLAALFAPLLDRACSWRPRHAGE